MSTQQEKLLKADDIKGMSEQEVKDMVVNVIKIRDLLDSGEKADQEQIKLAFKGAGGLGQVLLQTAKEGTISSIYTGDPEEGVVEVEQHGEPITVQTMSEKSFKREVVAEVMAEVIDSLDETDTGGPTIAAETEIIEKIFEAAKQRSEQNGGT